MYYFFYFTGAEGRLRSFSYFVLVVLGAGCGSTLIVLLLLLCCFRRTQGETFIFFTMSHGYSLLSHMFDIVTQIHEALGKTKVR